MYIQDSSGYILDLIAKGEHQEQDFKFEITDARKIAKTLSAFANTAGGRLLVGVKDNGKIAGVRSAEEEGHQIVSAAQLYCKPEPNFGIKMHKAEGKTVLEVVVNEVVQKPCYAMDADNAPKAYLRIHDENVLASPVHLRVWKMKRVQRGALIKYSAQEQVLLSHLSKNKTISISRYCEIASIPRQRAINTLAKFVHFDIAVPIYSEKGFVYQLIEEQSLA